MRLGFEDFGNGMVPISIYFDKHYVNKEFLFSLNLVRNPYQISEHHLGGGLLVLVSNGLHLGIIDVVGRLFCWIGSAQGTVGGHYNVILLAQSNQFLLVQRGMTFDLENGLLGI